MNAKVKTFIKSKLPKQYTNIHQVIDVVSITENSVELKTQFFKGVAIGSDKVEVIGIKQLVRDYQLEMLLK